MSEDVQKPEGNILKGFNVRKVDQRYIGNNKEKIFEAWKKVWEGSEWEEEEVFVLGESIDYISSIADKGFVYFIEDGDQIIAFAMATIGHFPKPRNSKEGEIYQGAKRVLQNPAYFHELAIIENYRGQGLGGTLMDMLEKKVESLGADGVFFWTRKGSRSQSLYHRKGYSHVGEVVVPKNNKVGKEDRVYFLKHF